MPIDEHPNENIRSPATPKDHRVKRSVARRIVVAGVFLVLCVGIIIGTGTGTLSSFGWGTIAAICPLGALEAMLAAHLLIPRGLVFILIVVGVCVILGKFFCSWICPIPSVRNFIETITHRKPKTKPEASSLKESDEKSLQKEAQSRSTSEVSSLKESDEKSLLKEAKPKAELEASSLRESDEKSLLKQAGAKSTSGTACAKSCNSCANTHRKVIDSRHLVLGGTLLSAALFGFPVFCLVCPIGLTFASVVVLVQLFGAQNLTWGLLLFPLLLVLELTLLRKWCLKICPMGALVSLLSLPNRLFRPKVNMKKCLRAKGVDCQLCTEVCPEELDPHTSEGMHDCSKCRDCAINCPAGAISFPVLPKS